MLIMMGGSESTAFGHGQQTLRTKRKTPAKGWAQACNVSKLGLYSRGGGSCMRSQGHEAGAMRMGCGWDG